MKTYTQTKSVQSFNKKALLGALLAAGMVMGSGSAGAATELGTLTVTATVAAACTIGDATLAFATYDPDGAAKDAQVDVAVNCTNGTAFNIYSSTALASRTMTTGLASADETLTYRLFGTDAERTAGTDLPVAVGAGDLGGTGTGSSVNIPIFGRITAAQNVFAGSYSGTANLTIDFP